MQDNVKKHAAYKIINDSGGRRYKFFCDISGASIFITKPIAADTPDEELTQAWNEAKNEFNRCEKCGKYVSDAMYNADVLQCVDCSPWENPPNFCSHCGAKIPMREEFCRKCGSRLHYREVWK